MTQLELNEQVAKNINWVQIHCAESPLSALAHFNRGIGFVEAVTQHYQLKSTDLLKQLEDACQPFRDQLILKAFSDFHVYK
jgi:hypothetical protein